MRYIRAIFTIALLVPAIGFAVLADKLKALFRRLTITGVRRRLARILVPDIVLQVDRLARDLQASREQEQRSVRILARLNDLLNRDGPLPDRADFFRIWKRAWNDDKPAFPEWKIDEIAAAIDPGAFQDDSKILGSVIGRREAARRMAVSRIE